MESDLTETNADIDNSVVADHDLSAENNGSTDPTGGGSDGGDKKSKGLMDRALGGLFWMYSGKTVFVILRAVVLIVLARLLTPEDYGLVSAALLFVNFIQLFSQLGVGPALVQRSELEERHLKTAFTVFTLSGIFFAAAVGLSAPFINNFFHDIDGLIPVLRVAVLAFPIQGFTAVPIALMRRELRFRELAKIDVLAYGGGYGIVGIGLAFLGFGAWALVGAVIARVSIAGILLMMAQPYSKKLYFERQAFQELMRFGGGFTIARLLDYVGSQGDNAMVGRELGAEPLGIYGRAFQLITIPSDLFGVVLDEVLFPSMAKLQDDIERLKLAYRYGLSLYSLVLLPFSAIALILAPEIVSVLLGKQWGAVVLPFQILVAAMLFRAGNRTNNSVAHAKGAVYSRSWRQAIFAVTILGGAWIGSRWGVEGVASSTMVALIINYLLMGQLAISLTTLRWSEFFIAHVPGTVLAGVTLGINWAITTALRSLSVPAFLILALSSILTVAGVGVLIHLMPRLLLGADGVWMIGVLTERTQKGKVGVMLKKFKLDKLIPKV